MILISELKKNSLTVLKNNWKTSVITILSLIGIILGASIIIPAIMLLVSYIPGIFLVFLLEESTFLLVLRILHYVLSFSGFLILSPLILGYKNFFLLLVKRQKPNISNLFDGYRKSVLTSIIGVLLTTIYTLLWSLLFIVPGIIKYLSYSMTFYILADNPSISAREAIKRSKAMMNGHKWKYFLMELSFIGWGILCLLTLNIGALWLTPYIETSKAHFYLTLKENFEDEINQNETIILEEF